MMGPEDKVADRERAVQEALLRVFEGRDDDKQLLLEAFAEWTQAFNCEAHADPTMRDILQGRRQAFFWLADRLQLPLAQVYARYLTEMENPNARMDT